MGLRLDQPRQRRSPGCGGDALSGSSSTGTSSCGTSRRRNARAASASPATASSRGSSRSAQASDEAVVAYAEEWGDLPLCRHGLPGASPRHFDDEDAPTGGVLEPDGPRVARRVAALVPPRRAHPRGVRRGGDEQSDCRPACGLSSCPTPTAASRCTSACCRGSRASTAPRGVAARRALVAQAVSYWLDAGGARVGMEWSTGARPRLVIGSGASPDAGIFGALGVELAGRCATAERLDVCDGCGRPFLMTPKQRARLEQRPGTRAFCPDCREAGVPARMADQDRRARQRAARGK